MKSLLYIVMIIVAAGCSCTSAQFIRQLDDAEALMQSNPVAALERLNSCDLADGGADSAAVARWALLYSRAMVANRLAAPADTIVDIAIEYYGRHSNDEQMRQATRLKALLHSGGKPDALVSALYRQKEKEFMLYKERTANRRRVAGGAALLLITLGAIGQQWRSLRRKDLLNGRLMVEASTLRMDLTRNLSERSQLESSLARMLAGRFDTIGQLCETYYETQGTKTERKAIADKVKEQIIDLRADDGLFAEMERCVDCCRSGLAGQLRAEWPSIKPDDYRLFVYLACNLSNRSIAALLNESIDVVYKRKSRLKARVSALGTPGSARFREIF